jgi:hypothetical protein
MRYLLGRLSAKEKASAEEQYFSDAEGFEELEIAEDELVDRYVKDELSGSDKRQFEKLLASPRISERVEIARLIAERSEARKGAMLPTPVPLPWWRRIFGTTKTSDFKPILAFALVLVVLPGIALTLMWMRLRNESQEFALQQQRSQQRLQQLEQRIGEQERKNKELEQNRDEAREENQTLQSEYDRLLQERQSTPTFIASVFLTPYSGTRGEGGSEEKRVTINKDTRAVKLNLDVEQGDYLRYQAIVQAEVAHKSVHHCFNLKPFPQSGRKYIRCVVPASKLTTGMYNVHVDGFTDSGEEDFRDYLLHVVSR